MKRPAATAPAGKRFWRCPSCGRTLGEVAGVVVVVRRRDFEGTFPAKGARQRCPNCGEYSTPAGRDKITA